MAARVNNLNRDFLSVYRRVFKRVESAIAGVQQEHKRAAAQRLLTCLLSVAFVERCECVNGVTAQLTQLWHSYLATDAPDTNFYRDRVVPLFRVLAAREHSQNELEAAGIPRLGLEIFKPDPSDQAALISDDAIRAVFEDLVLPFEFSASEGTSRDGSVIGPEILEGAFETTNTGRHGSGSYYTPRPIVTFMCREAIKGYLKTSVPEESDAALSLLIHSRDASSLHDRARVLEALRSMRVCDPACGCGAFLVGMLCELRALYAALCQGSVGAAERAWTRDIVERNLYGWDVDPDAVNIAKFRLWLACAAYGAGFTPASLELNVSVRDALLDTDGSSSFDVALMNPPYVATYSRQSEAVAIEQQLRERYGRFGGRVNLATCFLARACDLVRDGGTAAFIVPDSYATSDSYSAVRTFMRERFPVQRWTLIKPPVFGASVRNVVVNLESGASALHTSVVNTPDEIDDMAALSNRAVECTWGVHDRVPFFASAREAEIWTRIRQCPRKLGEEFVVKDGVNPGTRSARERLLAGREGDSLRRLIEGAHIDSNGYALVPPFRTIRYDRALLTAEDRRAGASLRDPSVFSSPKIVSRQTADTLIAAIDPAGDLVALNSVHCTRARDGEEEKVWGLMMLLNSPLPRIFYALDGGETRQILPQVHISWLRDFPLPQNAEAMLADLAPIARKMHTQAGTRAKCLRDAHALVACAYGFKTAQEQEELRAIYLSRYPRFAADWPSEAEAAVASD